MTSVLVIDGGGRGHAIVHALAKSMQVSKIWCAAGNAGIGEERLWDGTNVERVGFQADDLPGLLRFALSRKPTLTVVGGEESLALGIVDLFSKYGCNIWGPTESAARLEASKVFAHEFMLRHKIPAPRGRVFWFGQSDESKISVRRDFNGQCVVKPDGLCRGHGVRICHTAEEADRAIDEMFLQRAYGESGDQIVIQELLEGDEVSLEYLSDGVNFIPLPLVQDHKRLLDNDKGPMTGGMGTYSPADIIRPADGKKIQEEILQPFIEGCRKDGIIFKGVIYIGIMLTKDGPKVLEYNVRLGDPEAQVILPRLENDLFDLLCRSSSSAPVGSLKGVELKWRPTYAVCVVMATNGYPENPCLEDEIFGLKDVSSMPNRMVYHASTEILSDLSRYQTSGGRVLGVTAWAYTLQKAIELAYEGVGEINFTGKQYRSDIGRKGLKFCQEG